MDIIILTMSAKHGKYCVAGIDIDNGELVRLVSSDEESSGAINYSSTLIGNRVQCQPLDLVSVPILYSLPLEYQPENVLIDERIGWVHLDRLSLDDVLAIHALDLSPYIFGSTSYSLTEAQLRRVQRSLTIVKVKNLVINQIPRPDGSTKTKCSFIFNSLSYSNMSVTDPDYFRLRDGTIIENAIIIVSLPNQSYMDKWFKFVSKIFPLPQP